ncbi:hypothetical protein CEXT_735871 [Caerostris extrusa]|uniref:Uncharacterized protein n=1 Tax=Caerostris extrusa TaxID=172846 RepID=A0AAV4Y0E3_CAEEX|nr:hypothetical protein CEXT_735871 [Caerostris extrusa]
MPDFLTWGLLAIGAKLLTEGRNIKIFAAEGGKLSSLGAAVHQYAWTAFACLGNKKTHVILGKGKLSRKIFKFQGIFSFNKYINIDIVISRNALGK